MASQGQRFRRKALRRGYKVDEVDAFRPQARRTGDSVLVEAVAAVDLEEIVRQLQAVNNAPAEALRPTRGAHREWQGRARRSGRRIVPRPA